MRTQEKWVVDEATDKLFQGQQGISYVHSQLQKLAKLPAIGDLLLVMGRSELRLGEAQERLDGLLAKSDQPKQRRVTRRPRQMRYRYA